MKKSILISIMFLVTFIYAVYQLAYNKLDFVENNYCELKLKLKIYDFNPHITSLLKYGINGFLEYDLDINKKNIRFEKDDFFIYWIIDTKEIALKKICDKKKKFITEGISTLNTQLAININILRDNIVLGLNKNQNQLLISEIITFVQTTKKFVSIDNLSITNEKFSPKTYLSFMLELFYLNSFILILFIIINKLILFFKIRKIKII